MRAAYDPIVATLTLALSWIGRQKRASNCLADGFG